jgi:hypothetical protein
VTSPSLFLDRPRLCLYLGTAKVVSKCRWHEGREDKKTRYTFVFGQGGRPEEAIKEAEVRGVQLAQVLPLGHGEHVGVLHQCHVAQALVWLCFLLHMVGEL